VHPEVILLAVGLLAITLVGLSRRHGSKLLETASGYKKALVWPSRRQFFIGAFAACALVLFYLGWYPSASDLSELFAHRKGIYCFGGTETGIGNEVGEFQDVRIPPSNCMYATAHLKYPSNGYVQVVITYTGTGVWAYYGQEGEIRTQPFPKSNFGKPVEANWQWSNIADGFHERRGWLACTQVGKKFSCQGKLLTDNSAGNPAYEPVIFREKPNGRR